MSIDNEFLLSDRIAKIRAINEQYNLLDNAYISFSGGKDSTILHYLMDEALPGNQIPRVFINTGIEYKATLKFVKQMATNDNRFVIWTVGKDIKKTLNKVGWPFKSKEHAQKLYEWKRGCRSKSHMRYFRKLPNGFSPCPQVLMYQIQDDFDMNISHFCCHEFKKKPIKDYMKQSKRSITLTGMMRTEGGQRTTLNCIVTDKDGALKKFHPMAVCTTEWEDWYIKERGIKLSELYYPPFNFTRTGCIGCPFAKDIKSELETLSLLDPSEYKRAQWLWKTVYDEYRRIGYRLDNQPTLFD